MEKATKKIINTWLEKALSNPGMLGIVFEPIMCKHGHIHLAWKTSDDEKFIKLSQAVKYSLEKLWYKHKQIILKKITNNDELEYYDLIKKYLFIESPDHNSYLFDDEECEISNG